MIYFLKDKKLAASLKASTISERDKFIYFLIFLFAPVLLRFIGLLYAPHSYAGSERLQDPYFQWIVLGLLPIGILIFYLFYKINTKGDGLHFIERFICLNFPLSIHLMLIGFIGGIMGALIMSISSIMNLLHNDIVMGSIIIVTVLGVILLGYYCARMVMLLKIASGQKE